jgi:hypothetical protein
VLQSSAGLSTASATSGVVHALLSATVLGAIAAVSWRRRVRLART